MDVDTIAARHPDLKLVMAHMAHPWCEECIVVARKNDNVYCEVSALFYRPWQFWNALILAQEYRISERDKIFWGHRLPVRRRPREHRRAALDQRPGGGDGPATGVSRETMDAILHADPFRHWWHGGFDV